MKRTLTIVVILLALFALPALALSDPTPILSARGLTTVSDEDGDLGVERVPYTYVALVVADSGFSGIYWFDGHHTHMACDPADVSSAHPDPRNLVSTFVNACDACPDAEMYIFTTSDAAYVYSQRTEYVNYFISHHKGHDVYPAPDLDHFLVAVMGA